MNDFESIIRRRRSVRRFREGEISREQIERLVELALWAPSSCNRQTVHFRIVRDRGRIGALAPAAFNQPILGQPVTLAVVCVDTSRYRNTTLRNNLAPLLDAGCAMQNFLLAATAMGLGTCVVAGRLDQRIVRDVLRLPRRWMVAAFVAVGLPGEEQPAPEREAASLHVGYGDEPAFPAGSPYEEYAGLRRRWARAGFDVARYYHHPVEGLPVFRHALAVMGRRLVPDERWLVTSTLMGEFVFGEDNVDHLAASADEAWFLTEYLGSRVRIIHGDPAGGSGSVPGEGVPAGDMPGGNVPGGDVPEGNVSGANVSGVNVPERAYDRIVSPFDVHFLGAPDTAAFASNVVRWLKPGGTFTVIFFNRASLWGLNYLLARLLRRDVERFRFFGYEKPVSAGEVRRRFRERFRAASLETYSFLPPPNLGYVRGGMRLVPLGVSEAFDFCRKVPIIGSFGNIAVVDFSVK